MLRFQLCSARHTALHTLASAINPVITEVQMVSVGKPSSYRKSTPLAIGEKQWDTKEDKGKPMMRSLYILRYAKRHISGQSDVEQ